MAMLMRTLDKAAFKVGITPRPASESEIKQLTDNMFKLADADGGGDVSRQEFVSWSKDHLIGRTLINAFETIRTQEEVKAREVRNCCFPFLVWQRRVDIDAPTLCGIQQTNHNTTHSASGSQATQAARATARNAAPGAYSRHLSTHGGAEQTT